MEARDLLRDAFERVRQDTSAAIEGLDSGQISVRPDAGSNSIAWLVWHLTRVQDHHVSEIAGHPQTWTSGGWNERFGTDPDPDNTGYGHTPAEVAAIVPDRPDSLLDYHEAVHAKTLEYLATVDASELDRVIDRRWDPPVTVGVRLVSVINDTMQHAGQANYLRGLVERGAVTPAE